MPQGLEKLHVLPLACPCPVLIPLLLLFLLHPSLHLTPIFSSSLNTLLAFFSHCLGETKKDSPSAQAAAKPQRVWSARRSVLRISIIPEIYYR